MIARRRWSGERATIFAPSDAARTQRIHMGKGVTRLILRCHLSVIAQAATTLALMSGDRAYIAIGAGEALNEYATAGKWPAFHERQDRMAEAIELIRLLWSAFLQSYGREALPLLRQPGQPKQRHHRAGADGQREAARV